jgi:hypothetical protein
MRLLLLCLGLTVLVPVAATQPAPCDGEPAGYDGPCYYGALPAFFDDFEYASARTTGDVGNAAGGDLFAANEWHLRGGTETTRAWYRFNRDDLPIPGTITFGAPSVLTMRLPQGLESSAYARASAIHTGFTAEAGTFVWRAQLSELWEGQRVRQAIWTMSDPVYVFDPVTAEDTTRSVYWSELDFENENMFQGEHQDGVFVPDYVTRMSVGNHFGMLYRRGGSRRLSDSGGVDNTVGRGTLARDGLGRKTALRAPLVPSWADAWFYFVIEVDEATRSVTYRMIPERPEGALRALEEESFTVGPAFYPLDPTHPAFSLHWVDAEGLLRNPLYLKADWLYVTPVTGLSLEEVRAQVDHLRRRGLDRLNTTGRPTFEEHDATRPIDVAIEGPSRVQCGERAAWKVSVRDLGTYHIAYRYRVLDPEGAPGPWHEVFEPTFTLRPQSGQSGIVVEATAQDRWAPHGRVKGAMGWDYPHPDNDQAQARHSARFTCGPR